MAARGRQGSWGDAGPRCRRALLAMLVAAVALAPLAALVTLAAPAAGQPEGPEPRRGPPVIVLVHHPNDGVDPLGIPALGGGDAYVARYPPTEALPYPAFTADGVLSVPGLAEGRDALNATLGEYRTAVQARAQAQAPAVLRLVARLEDGGDGGDGGEGGDGGAGGRIDVTASAAPAAAGASLGGLRAYLAVVEDHVEARPIVTNGVFDHRFTVRSFHDLGLLDLAEPVTLRTQVPSDAAWDTDELSVAFWLQASLDPLSRFAAGEVVQATQAAVDGVAVVQAERGVLVEALSATWCEPCLVGDIALERLAVEAGVAQPTRAADAFAYLEPPQRAWSAWLAAAAAAACFVAARGRR